MLQIKVGKNKSEIPPNCTHVKDKDRKITITKNMVIIITRTSHRGRYYSQQ